MSAFSSHKKFEAAKAALIAVYSTCRMSQWTHQKLVEERHEALFQFGHGLTQYYRGKLEGISEGYYAALYNHCVQWCHCVDGERLVDSYMKLSPDEQKRLDDPSDTTVVSAFYWKHPDTGLPQINKRFT